MERCPNCNSTRLYNQISVVAKKNVNTGKIYGVDKTYQDNFFEPIYCEKCGWSNEAEITYKKRK